MISLSLPCFRCREDSDRARRVAKHVLEHGQGDCKQVRHRRLDLEYELQRRRLRLAARSTHDSSSTMCTGRQRPTAANEARTNCYAIDCRCCRTSYNDVNCVWHRARSPHQRQRRAVRERRCVSASEASVNCGAIDYRCWIACYNDVNCTTSRRRPPSRRQ